MRAGSDIGYCDSDQPKAPFEWCEQDIRTNLKAFGFEVGHIYLKDNNFDLYLTDIDTQVGYDFEDLEYTTYEEFTRNDFLKEWDQRFSPCCGADIIADYDRCKHCKEVVL